MPFVNGALISTVVIVIIVLVALLILLRFIPVGLWISALAAGAKVGITMEEPGVFTTGYGSAQSDDPSNWFFSDESGYAVQFNDGETEATLVEGEYYAVRIVESEHGSVTAVRSSGTSRAASPASI